MCLEFTKHTGKRQLRSRAMHFFTFSLFFPFSMYKFSCCLFPKSNFPRTSLICDKTPNFFFQLCFWFFFHFLLLHFYWFSHWLHILKETKGLVPAPVYSNWGCITLLLKENETIFLKSMLALRAWVPSHTVLVYPLGTVTPGQNWVWL